MQQRFLCLALDLLQTRGQIQESWISGTFFVVSEDQCRFISHALTNITVKSKTQPSHGGLSLYIFHSTWKIKENTTHNWRSLSFESKNLIAGSIFFLKCSCASPSNFGVNNLIYFFIWAMNCFLSNEGCSCKNMKYIRIQPIKKLFQFFF